MTRPMFADLVIQAPSIASCLESVMALEDADPYRSIDVPTLLLLGSAASMSRSAARSTHWPA